MTKYFEKFYLTDDKTTLLGRYAIFEKNSIGGNPNEI